MLRLFVSRGPLMMKRPSCNKRPASAGRKCVSGKPKCTCGTALSQLSPAMLRRWADHEGQRWYRLSSRQAYFRFCTTCHSQRWPSDIRSRNRYSRPGGSYFQRIPPPSCQRSPAQLHSTRPIWQAPVGRCGPGPAQAGSPTAPVEQAPTQPQPNPASPGQPLALPYLLITC